jgi:hypothetical protein
MDTHHVKRDQIMKRTGITKLFFITFIFLLLAGCGGGGGGGGGSKNSSNWDQMTWDKDNWG